MLENELEVELKDAQCPDALQYHLASLAEKTSQGCRTHAKERTPTIEKVRNHPRLVYLPAFKQARSYRVQGVHVSEIQ